MKRSALLAVLAGFLLSGSASAQDFDTLVDVVRQASNQKDTPIESYVAKSGYVLVRTTTKERWRVEVALAKNKQFFYITFPCQFLPKGDNSQRVVALLKENIKLGMMRFEVSRNLVRLVFPNLSADLDPNTVNARMSELLDTARNTAKVWNFKAKKDTAVAKPVADAKPETSPKPVFDLGEFLSGQKLRTGLIGTSDAKIFGSISMAPNGNWAWSVRQLGKPGQANSKGTYKVQGDKLVLTHKAGPSQTFTISKVSEKSVRLTMKVGEASFNITLFR